MRFNGDAYEDVHAQLSAGIAEHFQGPYAGKPVVERAWISATEAAHILKVRGERVVAAVASGKLEGKQAHSGHGHKHTMVPRAAVEGLKIDRAKYLTAKSAMEMLGVGKAQFRIGSVYKSYGFMVCSFQIRGINDHGLQAVSGMALGD